VAYSNLSAILLVITILFLQRGLREKLIILQVIYIVTFFLIVDQRCVFLFESMCYGENFLDF
jgi:hypothetical protein